MTENDPNNEKDIWSKRPKKEGPPDLDELLNKLQKKINDFFGRKKKAIGPAEESKPPQIPGTWIIGFVIFVIVVIWALSGIFIVSPAERAAVLRFGKYVDTVGPGPHWLPRFIESRYVVNVQRVSTFPYQAEMLTKDENIVSVSVAVQYRVGNLRNYLFNVVDADASLQQATASALRQVVGHTTLDEILTTGRELAREQITQQLNNILALYHAGIIVTDVVLQPAKPPEAVTEAFDDVNKAREDEQRYINYANAYQQKVVPIAQGQAARILKEAQAYKQQVILKSQADTARYLALLPQYQRAPLVTRERLYLDAMESVLQKSSKILLDTKSGSVMYLPLDKFIAKKVTPVKLPEVTEMPTVTKPKANIADSPRPARAGYSNGGTH